MTKRIPPVIKNEITRAYQRGDGTSETAKDFGVSAGYPSRAAKEAGIALRRPRKGGKDGQHR